MSAKLFWTKKRKRKEKFLEGGVTSLAASMSFSHPDTHFSTSWRERPLQMLCSSSSLLGSPTTYKKKKKKTKFHTYNSSLIIYNVFQTIQGQ